jgi:hypothetical protein
MPNHVDDVLLHAMDGSELSRVRTEFNQLRILPIVSAHPVQPNSKFSGHGQFESRVKLRVQDRKLRMPIIRLVWRFNVYTLRGLKDGRCYHHFARHCFWSGFHRKLRSRQSFL